MIYLLDTNIFVSAVRNDVFKKHFYATYGKLENILLTSVVVEGELASFYLQWKWGQRKMNELNHLLNRTLIYPIKTEATINAYAQIDAFSQGKLADKPLGTSARNMGKNDLWIAATASVTNATLITADKDFGHLNGVFFKVEEVEVKSFLS